MRDAFAATGGSFLYAAASAQLTLVENTYNDITDWGGYRIGIDSWHLFAEMEIPRQQHFRDSQTSGAEVFEWRFLHL